MLRHRPTIERLTPYSPGKSIQEVQEAFGLESVVKLASNENPLGPSQRAQSAAEAALRDIHRYPDGAHRRLIRRLASHLDVPEDFLVVGNGSDEVLKLIGEAYLDPGDEVVYADPTFSEYAYVARLCGATERVVPLTSDERHDLQAMAEAVNPRTKIVFVCNPNNPTGTIVHHDELQSFLDKLPESILVVIDEAYFEYVTDPRYADTVSWIREGRNIIVLRTFSKVYGLAGLRVGYGIGLPETIAMVRRVKEPFNVNSIAQAAAEAALDDADHLQASLRLNSEERERVSSRLRELGLRVTPSQANFIWVELDGPADPVYRGLLRRGVIVRSGEAFGRPRHLRITIGTPQENDLFLDLLPQVLSTLERSATS